MDNGYKSTITTRLKLPQVSDERRYGWKVKSVAVAFPAVTEERRPITQLRPIDNTIRQRVMDEKMDVPPVHLRTGTNFRLGSTDPNKEHGQGLGGQIPGCAQP
jgi:hypothetical protein